MGRAQPDIHGLIEEGLTRYGRGDLDGALLSWEQVLQVDPHHEQALGYIDYVRMNYELIVTEVSAQTEAPAFAIAGDEPEHRIDTPKGELAVGSAVPRYGAAFDGWAIEEEEPGYGRMTVKQLDFDPGEGELELEPFHVTEPAAGMESSGVGLSFEEETSEYAGPGEPAGASQEFKLELTPTSGFDPDETPPFGIPGDLQTPHGFGTQLTDVRPRDLGFVQPVAPPAAPSAPAAAPSAPSAPDPRRAPAPTPSPEMQTTIRMPSAPARPAPAQPAQAAGEPPRTDPSFDPYDPDPPTIERSPSHPSAADLLSSLPSRRVARSLGGSTREMPAATRKPASVDIPIRDISPPRATVAAMPPRTSTPLPGVRSTLEGLPPVRTSTPIPSAGRTPTPPSLDLSRRSDTNDFDAPTERKDLRGPTAGEIAATVGARGGPVAAQPGARPPQSLMGDVNPLISAPTRDLGLRPTSGGPRAEAGGAPPDPAGAGAPARPSAGAPLESTPTRSDMVLPFDPIDARSAQIIAAIDARSPGPADESHEDRTRRRITALFEHAVEWNKVGEIDRAVAAIDLALSEDPNSALAQKLIHRNRDTIMNVFQAFLGDLHRTPILARPLHELAESPISPRAAFLLSRVDGLLSLDEILDVSGMPRMEAYRYLCQLFLRGILR